MAGFEQFRTKAEAIKHLMAKKDIPCQTAAQAEKYLQEHLPKESYYQDKIIKHIRGLIPSSFVWKAAAGPYSRQGIPDICAIVNGRYYGFEVKRPFFGILSKIQERTIKQIWEAGGKAYVVTYPEEVTRILGKEIRGGMNREARPIAQTEDESEKYMGMIESLECDFSLAADQAEEYSLGDLQAIIDQGDRKILSDIELLKELSYGLRNGTLKIIWQPEKEVQHEQKAGEGSHAGENEGGEPKRP